MISSSSSSRMGVARARASSLFTSSSSSLRSNPTICYNMHLYRKFASSAQDDRTSSRWYPIGVVVVGGGLVITVGGGIKYWHDHVGGLEGLKRSAIFYSYAIPKYIQYRYHAWVKSPDEVWDALDKETSKRALEIIQDLVRMLF